MKQFFHTFDRKTMFPEFVIKTESVKETSPVLYWTTGIVHVEIVSWSWPAPGPPTWWSVAFVMRCQTSCERRFLWPHCQRPSGVHEKPLYPRTALQLTTPCPMWKEHLFMSGTIFIAFCRDHTNLTILLYPCLCVGNVIFAYHEGLDQMVKIQSFTCLVLVKKEM